MACGCSGSSTPAREARQQARNEAAQAAGAPARRGVNSPGYFYTGPRKRAEQDQRR